jgi:hypothetical protein
MQPGTYKNKAGAVLHVTGPFKGTHRVLTLGGIYEADAPDDLLGPKVYLVTKESMAMCGYELVEAA